MLDVSFAKPTGRNPARSCCWWKKAASPAASPARRGRRSCRHHGARVSRALKAAEFKGRGADRTMLAPGGGLSRVVAVGLGKLADLTACAVEDAGGSAAAALAAEPAAAIARPG